MPSTSAVFVVVMDWTEMGASPPTATYPTWICRVDPALGPVRFGWMSLEGIGDGVGDVEEDGGGHEDDQEEHEGRGHRDQLGHVGVVGLALAAADPFVDGDQNMTPVEGEHGDQVDDARRRR